MDDTISRMAAIRWVKTECNPYGNPTLDFESGKKVIEHLLQMPPAQPEILACGEGELNVLDTNVADCSDCIKHGGDWDCDHVHCHKGKSAQPHGREKLVRPIDADMAIDAIQKDRETSWKELENDDAEYRNGCDDGYAYSMQIISELPSVERKGKWISVHDDIFADRYYCSCCKAEPICNDTEYILSNYCPNCGADMKGE